MHFYLHFLNPVPITASAAPANAFAGTGYRH